MEGLAGSLWSARGGGRQSTKVAGEGTGQLNMEERGTRERGRRYTRHRQERGTGASGLVNTKENVQDTHHLAPTRLGAHGRQAGEAEVVRPAAEWQALDPPQGEGGTPTRRWHLWPAGGQVSCPRRRLHFWPSGWRQMMTKNEILI